jgi:cysteine desulfurase / selenocysteine lyase
MTPFPVYRLPFTAIYLDNGATTFPKPKCVIDAITEYLSHYGASPGRSGHTLSVQVAREVFETRELIAGFFNAPASERVIFTANATQGLNMAIKGVVQPGDHVIIGSMEHNSVYRPVRHLEHRGLIDLSVALCDTQGNIDLHHLKTLFRPNTRMVIVNHGSNVLGTVQPIREIGSICREHEVLFVVDAAQTAGLFPIDLQADHIDILVFSGHKKLYGPPGIGGMVIGSDLQIEPLLHGGTGSRSESDLHPGFYPDRLEAGTPNTLGIIGLKAGIKWVQEQGLDHLRNHTITLTRMLADSLRQMDHITLHGPQNHDHALPLLSITIKEKNPADMALYLDREHGIMTRPGLHCTPLAHKTAGTFPQGTLRFSFGAFNTTEDVTRVAEAMKNEE